LLFEIFVSVHSEIVDFGSGRGHSVFATGGVARYVEDCKRARTLSWAERCYFWMDTS